MRTWSLHVLALFIIEAVCAEDSPPSKPQPPTDLEAAHLSPTSIFLRWKWQNEDTGAATANFTVNATGVGFSQVVSVNGKLYSVVDRLVPGAEYDITVGFLRDDGAVDLSGTLKLRTSEKDFQRPTVVGNTAGDKNDSETVPYITTWTFNENGSAAGKFVWYEILHCTTSCNAQRAKTDENSVKKELDYYTDYTVLVSAVFEEAAGNYRKLASPESIFKTVTGKPGNLGGVYIEQDFKNGLTVTFIWWPPNKPNGVIESYDLQLFADGKSVLNESSPGWMQSYDYKIEKREQLADSFLCRIRAINNGLDDYRFGDFSEHSYSLEKPSAPISVNLLERRANSLKLSVDPGKLFPGQVRISYENGTDETRQSPAFRLRGFQPYTGVPLKIALCSPLERDEGFCGPPYDAWFKTNVDAPSPVRNQTLKRVDGNFVLSWREPEIIAGPMNGYIVRIKDGTHGNVVDTTLGDVLEYTLPELKKCTQYSFVVMAFNYDLDSREKCYTPADYTLFLDTDNCPEDDSGKFPALAIVVIALVVLFNAFGIACYIVRRRSRSPLSWIHFVAQEEYSCTEER